MVCAGREGIVIPASSEKKRKKSFVTLEKTPARMYIHMRSRRERGGRFTKPVMVVPGESAEPDREGGYFLREDKT